MVGAATITETIALSSACGIININSLDVTSRFAIEVAKGFTAESVKFYDEKECEIIMRLHGEIRHILTRTLPT